MTQEAVVGRILPMAQMSMFESVPERQDWSNMVLSASHDQDRILRGIMDLHNGGKPFELDPTYSKGVFYRNLPQPTHKFDLAPQSNDVQQADACDLPFADCTIESIMFDPPFLNSHSNTTNGKIKARFTSFKSTELLWAFYRAAMEEFWRILKPKGLLVFKCQDVVSGGRNHWSCREIERYAEEIGYQQVDLFILLSKSIMWSPNMRVQRHARKVHSYFICFKKPKGKG